MKIQALDTQPLVSPNQCNFEGLSLEDYVE